MKQPCRLHGGSAIDVSRVLAFTFNGKRYHGHPGDTLASALLANGVHFVGRSFKYHRPRGIVAAGVEEPNAIVQVGEGARSTPNLKATEIPLYEGLVARSVNVFPSLDVDLGAVSGWFSGLMPAGFYYKTFFGSPWLWQRAFEPLIRRAGGLGRTPAEADPDRYERRYDHCDLLVVGAGPAGIAAACAAAASGARVILADENDSFGGSLLARCASRAGGGDGPTAASVGTRPRIDGQPALRWLHDALARLAAGSVRMLPRTTVFGFYDNNCLAGVERLAAAGEVPPPHRPRERIRHFRCRGVVLATGAHERPLVFANNDRPGIMLAGAVEAYIHRWGVRSGRRAVLFTNNDRAYATVAALAAAGTDVITVVDTRDRPPAPLVERANAHGVPVRAGHAVCDTRGGRRLKRVAVAPLAGGRVGRRDWIACDLLAVSGGWSPVVHLHSQAQGRLVYDETWCCFRPDDTAPPRATAGACNGTFSLAGALAEGHAAGLASAAACGLEPSPLPVPAVEADEGGPPVPLWRVPEAAGAGYGMRRHFVDLQNDTTAADIRLAVREGFESVEHMKRYTLAGFGTDQGKTGNVNGLAMLAEMTGASIAQVGTTTFRPPYTPVTFAAMGGRDRGTLFEPERLTAMHERHLAAGAVFEDVGQWKRAWYYPRPGEDMAAAVARECRAVRERVGVMDASTLGKIDIQGPDAAEFLELVYTNDWQNLPVGRVRYGIMCREDGMVFDDGTTARLAEDRYLLTTTTGNAAPVLEHLEEYLQTEWPQLRVRLTSVTEQWAVAGVAGPLSRRVLEKLSPNTDFSAQAFPFLSWRRVPIGGVEARVFRISFTGELQYEINVPWHYGASLWDAVMYAGAEFGIAAYGTETMHVLRAEKGFIIVGQETDGTQTPRDLGLAWAVSKTKKDFIGRRSLARPDCTRPDRKQLVGLRPEQRDAVIPEGAQLVPSGLSGKPPPVPMEGFVTSSYSSPALGGRFCLALVKGGRGRYGEVLEAVAEGRPVRVTICDPVFYDKEGARRDGD